MAIQQITKTGWVTSDGFWFEQEEEALKREVSQGIRRLLDTHGWASMDSKDVADILSNYVAELKELLK